jgi:hypothetical protein
MADGFLSRWSKRKTGKQEGPVDKKLETAAAPTEPLDLQAAQEQAPPPVSLDDVEKIDRFDPDFSAFMKPDVDPTVQQAALKKMFTDPHFNVMDGLDIYIDDYSKPDPLPPGMLERMVQSDMLNLFRKSEDVAARKPSQDKVEGETAHQDEDLLEAQKQSDLTSPNQSSTQLDNSPVESESKKT